MTIPSTRSPLADAASAIHPHDARGSRALPDRLRPRPASAAAPTAGLHLTDDVFAALSRRDRHGDGRARRRPRHVRPDHPGRPVDASDALRALQGAATDLGGRRSRRRVVAVGTTTVRALETVAATGELSGRTDLFLHPGRGISVVDVLMTNFHLPRTTLLLMIETFVGTRWRLLYAAAARWATGSCPSAMRCCSTATRADQRQGWPRRLPHGG